MIIALCRLSIVIELLERKKATTETRTRTKLAECLCKIHFIFYLYQEHERINNGTNLKRIGAREEDKFDIE